MSWFSRVCHALRPARLDDELAEELRDHLERRAAQFREDGVDAAEADRQARLVFGNPTAIRERSRDIRLSASLESTVQDLRYAARGLRKSPAFALTAIVSLALAVGSLTAIYSIIEAAMLRPLPVPDPGRLVTLAMPEVDQTGRAMAGERELFSYPLYLQLSSAAEGLARLALFRPAASVESQFAVADAPVERLTLQFVSGDAFEILGVAPALGRLFANDDDRIPGSRGVVLSRQYWKRRFNLDPGVLGQRIFLDGRLSHVIGVTDGDFAGVEPGKFVDVWLPVSAFDPGVFSNPDADIFRITGRLMAGSPTALQARLQPVFHQAQAERVQRTATLSPALRQQLLGMALAVNGGVGVSDFRRTFGPSLWTLLGVSAGMLLIACANVASLLLARAVARGPEMALRASLGASRARLLRQLLVESLLLSGLAGALGWALAAGGAPLLLGLLSSGRDQVHLALGVNIRVLLFGISVGGLSTLAFGLMPAWQSAGTKATIGVHGPGADKRSLRAGRVFVAAQLAFAFCLVVTGAAFASSLWNLTTLAPGFEPRGLTVLTIGIDTGPDRAGLELTRELQSRVAALPTVTAAAVAWWAMFDGQARREKVIIAGKTALGPEEVFARISPGYFAALKTPVLGGRDFDRRDDETGPRVPTIVNQAFAHRYFGTDAVIGQQFQRTDGAIHEIVGVVGNAYYSDFRNGPQPIVYFPMKPPRQFALYVRSTLDAGTVAQLVDREARMLGHGAHVAETTTLGALIDHTLQRERILAGVGGLFGALGLLLAALGLFGLLNYTVVRRTAEIGIRAALGATPRGIVRLVLQDVAGMVGCGLAVGLLGAIGLLSVTRSLLFGVRAVDPVVVGSATLLFCLAALAAAALPAVRASSIDPLVAVRRV